MNPDALPTNLRINKYLIQRVLGAGNFGITYKCRDTELERDVAIKEFYPVNYARRWPDLVIEPLDDPRSREVFAWGLQRFFEEAIVLAKFDHRNIVPVLDILNNLNGSAYIVMSFIDGVSLERYIEENGLPPAKLFSSIFGGLLDGVEALHRIAIIHRDIKPSNIMMRRIGGDEVPLEQRWLPILVDFGSARDIALRQTGHSQIVTEGYSPPEQYSATLEQTAASDIYALAATGLHILTGALIPPAAARIVDPLPSVRPERIKGLPTTFLPGLLHGLNLDIGKRPSSIAAWRTELGLHEAQQLPVSRRGIVYAGGAILALAAAGGVAYVRTRPQRLDDQPRPLRIAASREVGSVGIDPFVEVVTSTTAGAMLASHFLMPSGLRHMMATEFNADLSIRATWRDDRDDGEAVAIAPAPGGGALVGGRVGTIATVIRLGPDWRPQWRVERGEGRVASVTANEQGCLIGIQGIEGPGNPRRARVEQLDRRGSLLWGVDFEVGQREYVERIIRLASGGYAVLGRGDGVRDTAAGPRAANYAWVALSDDQGNTRARSQTLGLGTALPTAIIEVAKRIYVTGQTSSGVEGAKPQMMIWTIEPGGVPSIRWDYPHLPSSGRALCAGPGTKLYIAGWGGVPTTARIAQIGDGGNLVWDQVVPIAGGNSALIDLALDNYGNGFAATITPVGPTRNRLQVHRLVIT